MADQLVNQQSEVVNKTKGKFSLFSKTRFYVFEYTVLQLAVLFLGSSFATVIFILFGTISGQSTISSSIESLVWVFGLCLVLVPLITVLYARTSAEEALHPARHNQTPRKFVFYTMLVISTISALGFLIASVYTVSRVAFGLSGSELITQVTLPSLVMFGLTMYYILAIQKNFAPSKKLRKINILSIAIVGTLVILSILVAASINSSANRSDQQITSDLNAAKKSIDAYFQDNNKLPVNISATNLNAGVKSQFEVGKYKYEVTQDGLDYGNVQAEDSSSSSVSYLSTSSQYRLCATFSASKGYYNDYSYGSYSGDLNNHKKGYQCLTHYAY